MQNTLKLISRRFCPAVAALATLGLMLAGGQAVQAQASFSLLPLSTSGSTATFAVDLTGGANLSGFDFNVTLDPAYLSFAGTTPFTSGTANPFDTQIYNALANSSDPSDLRVTYGQVGSAISSIGTVALGTFQVNILQPLPAAGTVLSFGPIGSPDAPTNGSQIYDVNGINILTDVTGTLLTPAAVPEASSVVSFGLLLILGLGGLRVSVKRRAAQSTKAARAVLS